VHLSSALPPYIELTISTMSLVWWKSTYHLTW